ncbi:MAG: hypothetical protein NTX97_07980, partial [Bacteroidetes bacterium]|nr:hypothetical protein [Bacteroidota bacterium]
KSKKLLFVICFLVLLSSSSLGQSVGDYQSLTTGNWNNLSTWQQCVTAGSWSAATIIPSAASGIITIQSAHTVTINSVLSNSASIIINSGATLTNSVTSLTNNPIGIITVNGAFTNAAAKTILNNGTILNNSTFTNNGTFTNSLTLNNATGATITQAGTFTNSSTGTINNIGTLTINNSKTISNNGTITNSGTINTTGILNNLAGSFYKHNFISSVGTIPTATWDLTSTCEIDACLSPSSGPIGINQNFGNFIWNTTGQLAGDINLAGLFKGTPVGSDFTLLSTGTLGGRLVLKTSSLLAPPSIGRNFSISGGTLVGTIGPVGSNQSNISINIIGTYTQTGGTVIIAENTSGSAAANGNGDITVGSTTSISGGTLTLSNSPSISSGQGSGTFTSGGNMTISNTAIVNLSTSTGNGSGGNGNLNVTGTLTISGGTLNLCSSTRTVGGGNGIVTSGGLITLSGGTINGSTSNAVTTGCNATINANAGFSVTGGTLNLTPGNVTSDGGNGTINITGDLNISGGNLNLNTSTGINSLGSNGLIAVIGNCTISGGTINVTSSSVTSGGGNGTITVSLDFTMSGASTSFNLCSSSGSGTDANGLLDIEGSFTVSDGTFDLTSATRTGGGGTGTINVAKNFIHTSAAASFKRTSIVPAAIATINIDGTSAYTQTLQSTYGFSGTIDFNIIQDSDPSAICSIPAANTFIVNSGTSFNVYDNIVNISGSELKVIALGTLKVSGQMTVFSDATLDLTTNAITDATTGAGSFNLASSATLITQHPGGVSATAGLGCVQITGIKTFSSDANYTYNGAIAQVTGDGLPATLTGGILNIANTLAPSVGGVTLTRTTTIQAGPSATGMLFFGGATNGRLITSSSNLIIVDNLATISPAGGSATKFVDGPIKKIGFSATPFIFPTGDIYAAPTATSKWARISITTSASATDAFTAEYHKLDYTGPGVTNQVVSNTNGPGVNHVSYREYWDLTRVSGTTTPTVKLYWENNSSSLFIGSAIPSPTTSNLHVAEYDGGMWNDRGATGIIISGITGNITSNITNTFTTGTIMPFTFSGPTSVNPLPIELLSFTGYSLANGNQLNWVTATETNNDFFDLERSSDGIEFYKIATIDGAGNSTSIKNYEYYDANPLDGLNYYRLKQVDFNGDFFYSNIISIDKSIIENTFIQVFPNPSSDIVNIITSNNITSLFIYDMIGNIVYSNSTAQKSFQFDPIAKGFYLIKTISKEGKESSTRFIKN